jgi:3D (Asp-Asp-Asp) domain-containing protein
MIRYFYWVGLFLLVNFLGMPTKASENKKVLPYEDWQLPTFVANVASGNKATDPELAWKKSVSKSEKLSDKRIAAKTSASAMPLSTTKHTHSLAASTSVGTDDGDKPIARKPTSKTAVSDNRPSLASSIDKAAVATAHEATRDFGVVKSNIKGRLARLTAYWAGEGDYYTGRCLSSTGIHLHGGHCAVDPSIIPYGSVVEIPGIGEFLAVDTGSAVVSREAAREAGHTPAERGALVIDLFFEHSSDGERFAANGAKFVPISWWTPQSTGDDARQARSVFAEEDWNKIYSKQL